jgi:hypothetical protein
MTRHDTSERDSAQQSRGEPGPKTIWGHSLAAAAVCLGTGATIALIAILGQSG